MIFNVIYRPLYKLDLYSGSIKTKKFTVIFLYRYRYLFRDNCSKSFFTFRRNKEYLSGIIIGIRPGSGSTFLVYRIGVTGYCKFYIAIFHDEDSIRSCLSDSPHTGLELRPFWCVIIRQTYATSYDQSANRLAGQIVFLCLSAIQDLSASIQPAVLFRQQQVYHTFRLSCRHCRESNDLFWIRTLLF